MTPTSPPVTAVQHLDPRELIDHPTNVRKKLGDIAGLAETIRALGVLQPLLIERNNGDLRIVAGRRRAAAAIKAGEKTVPCIVRDDWTEAQIASASAVENLQRKDLTVVEEAQIYEQMGLTGLDAAAIAAAAGVQPARVLDGRVVAASKVATAVTTKHDLTLEQAVAIADFDDDKEAVKRLTVAAVQEPERFGHLLSRLTQERIGQRAVAAEVEKLAARSVTVAVESPRYGQRLDMLAGPVKGKAITAAQHRKCPGHAAYVQASWDGKAHVTYICTDPTANNHKQLGGGRTGLSPGSKMAEKEKEQRREVIENNKQWRAAEPVRRVYVRSLLAAKALPKMGMRFLAQEIMGDPTIVNAGNDALLADLLSVDPDTYSKEPEWTYGRRVGLAIVRRDGDHQLGLRLLALVAAGAEQRLTVSTWRGANEGGARWLQFLAACGYSLSDIEKLVIDTTTR